MKIGLLGTGFGVVHAGIYHDHPEVGEVVVFGRTAAKLRSLAERFGYATTTTIDTIYDDPEIDLIDVCLPTAMHADHIIRALKAGKHVLCELPLASTMADASRIVDAEAESDRQVFVAMFSRFDPEVEFLHRAIRGTTYGSLKTLRLETRTALLWEGYQLGLESIALDVMHSNLDTIVTALGRPVSVTAVGTSKATGGSAAEVLLSYPGAIVQCGASSLMPRSYDLRGTHRAVFTEGALEAAWTAGSGVDSNTTLTEYTEQGKRDIDLGKVDAYSRMIDHVIACCQGRAASRIASASVLDSLHVTLDVQQALVTQK